MASKHFKTWPPRRGSPARLLEQPAPELRQAGCVERAIELLVRLDGRMEGGALLGRELPRGTLALLEEIDDTRRRRHRQLVEDLLLQLTDAARDGEDPADPPIMAGRASERAAER